MDCKRLIAIGLAVVACSESSTIPSRFDGPVSGDVLDAEEGPFSRPVGLVANTRSGQVLPIDLSKGWLLSDSTGSPFLAADPIAAGANRVLGEIMVHSPDQQSVRVFAVDKGSEELLEFPWIEGVEDGRLLRASPEASEVVFEDAEPSGDAVTVANLQLLSGHTTTEDWVLTYDGTSWTVEGSASGIQELRAHLGVPYRSDEKALRFTLVGEASAGDIVRFSTSTGLVRHQLGGAIQEAVKLDGTGGLALLSLKDAFDQAGRLVFFDLSEGTPVGDLPLPPGSMPYRVAADGEASWAYVVDLELDGVHAVELNNPFPLTSSVSWIDVGFPVSDIAVVKGDDYEHLFIARADRNEVVVC